MIQFKRLRINGFKSFVDRTELDIGRGLNGIVGPNGCGKSNLVEAMRWVMGESSAKRMRGGGMEDVIFNGTSKRTQRNIAEVSLLLDNSARTAPAVYNGTDEIEITRRIERDHGSNYKINGKNVRARDVQMLFADTVTGANSPAMVSQGRITQIINAKPLQRRLVLEESAGITGLFARRHEAELRLRAADTNLVRIEDILGSMEGRLSALKRQVRQATRYKNISTQIRQMEILIAYVEWQALEERMSENRKAFNDAESEVAQHLGIVTALNKTQSTQAEDLPVLRMVEAEIGAKLQTQRLALQRLEDESTRLDQLLSEAKSQYEQITHDQEHETQSLEDSTQLLTKLESEHTLISNEQNAAGDLQDKKSAACDVLEKQVSELEERYNVLMQGAAEAKARKNALESNISNNENRLQNLKTRKDNAANTLKELKIEDAKGGDDFEEKIQTLEQQKNKQSIAIEKLQGQIELLFTDIESVRENTKKLENKKSEFHTEINVLENILNAKSESYFTPILDNVSAEQGFEKALSRALGDSLMASLDEKANTIWLPSNDKAKTLPSLPKEALALRPHVKAPEILNLTLSQIGVVEDTQSGNDLWQSLATGQSLVSKDGTYWRWDGYCVKSDAPDRHAQQLEQRNKLNALSKEYPKTEQAAEKARKALDTLIEKQEQKRQTLKTTQSALRDIEQELTQNRNAWAKIRDKKAHITSEINRLNETIKTTQSDIDDVLSTLENDQKELATQNTATHADKEQQLETLRTTLQDARQSHAEAIRAYDQYIQQRNSRQARMQAIGDERVNLQNRAIRSRERIKELTERSATLQEKIKSMSVRPEDFENDKARLLTAISQIEKNRNAAAEKLATVENEVTETGRALKEAERSLGQSRESRAHAQALISAMQEQQETLHQSITEKFDVKPENLREHSAINMDSDFDNLWGNLESLKGKKDTLLREREQIGAVNLRAEEEATTLEKEVTTLLHERNDLVQAIEELRAGIQKINKEARERLIAAFEHVNAHFQRLFIQLFGGGRAHLALVESDDPLNSGLEIFAQPPGKTLQSLSLLSGGEQTMASIALIFAMFLTNPSPICVLDEIDAPLDDANVDRVCDLLDEIAERGETRFLIITHHRLSMARMDRLYGVTMAERGISQLVSVDLQQSFDFLEEAA